MAFDNSMKDLRDRAQGMLFGAAIMAAAALLFCGGCGGTRGYSKEWLYPTNVESVYVEMFENDSFRRGLEFTLTDAVAKRIESETPYKIVSDRDLADTVLSGKITSWSEDVLSYEKQTGRPMQEQADVVAVVTWKNLKTGQLMLDNKSVSNSMTFSEFQNQSFEYASAVAANRLAERVVEQMQNKW
jgi:hypothetical protein